MRRMAEGSCMARLLSCLLALLYLSACDSSEVRKNPTQITLEIDSQDSALLEALTELEVGVALQRDGAWQVRRSVTVAASELNWPVDIPVTPRTPDDDAATFEVVVQALADGRVLAQTRAITAFKPSEHRTLKLRLFGCPGRDPGFTCAEADCQGETCEVCAANGQCVPVTQIDPDDLPPTPVDGADAGDDAGEDASAMDAGEGGVDPDTDAGADAALDATPELDAAMDADSGAGEAGADAAADAAPADAADGALMCQATFKRCGAACIPVANCCEDNECGAGTLCRQGTCKRWCEEQTRPNNVLAADYQCVDFEHGLPPDATWMRKIEGAGTLALAMDRAFSAPTSIRVSGATLAWKPTGSAQIRSLSFNAEFNPTQHHTVLPEPLVSTLLCFKIGDSANGSVLNHCIIYTYKGWVDGIENYTGLYLETLFIGPPAFVSQTPLFDPSSPSMPLTFNMNLWNHLEVQIGSDVRVKVNEKTATVSGGVGQDTQVEVSFGASWPVNYDNVVVSVGR